LNRRKAPLVPSRRCDMRCPACDHELQPASRQAVAFGCCPQCRGAWLERGELDKLLRRGDGPREVKPPGDGDRKPDNWPLAIDFYDFG
jgi:Zn-finger nucleic acid-binding protein